MSNFYENYGEIPESPVKYCRRSCSDTFCFYAAISKSLNERAVLGKATDKKLVPYVFKTGSTKHNCYERRKGLVEDRKPIEGLDEVMYAEPRYAGVSDWKMLKCWKVSQDRHDDKRFKPWLKQSSFRDKVYHLTTYSTGESEGVLPRRGFEDLSIMSEAYVRSLVPVLINDPMNEELLGIVSKTIVLLVTDYAKSLGG